MLGNRLEKIMNQARLQFINLDSDDGLSPDQSSDSAKEEGGTKKGGRGCQGTGGGQQKRTKGRGGGGKTG